jgi:hypothetical protein
MFLSFIFLFFCPYLFFSDMTSQKRETFAKRNMHVLWRLHMVASGAIELTTCDFSILHLSKGKQSEDKDERGTHQV